MEAQNLIHVQQKKSSEQVRQITQLIFLELDDEHITKINNVIKNLLNPKTDLPFIAHAQYGIDNNEYFGCFIYKYCKKHMLYTTKISLILKILWNTLKIMDNNIIDPDEDLEFNDENKYYTYQEIIDYNIFMKNIEENIKRYYIINDAAQKNLILQNMIQESFFKMY